MQPWLTAGAIQQTAHESRQFLLVSWDCASIGWRPRGVYRESEAMTKSIIVDPSRVRQRTAIESRSIPINAYVPDPETEEAKYGSETLVRMYEHMVYIREFETMLESLRTQASYAGVEFSYKGPLHLSIGQEASAVGEAHHLEPDDLTFGAHRSHGEFLAKGLSCIDKLSEDELLAIMETYMGGAQLRVVESLPTDDVASLATNYLLYGLMAEIMGRETGFNRGLGGSMHAFFPPFGIMPNNAIVGGSAGIAVGAALFKRLNRVPGIVVANLGDGASACGPVWESFTLSAMDQYRTLWDEELGRSPPVLFYFNNNFYSMGGQPAGETMGYRALARIGLGVNPEGMHAERVDGYNPVAVADAVERKKSLLQEGRGPVLLDVITYRYRGHSPSDANAYRARSEIELWRSQDSIESFREYLIRNRHAEADTLGECAAAIRHRLVTLLRAVTSDDLSPRMPAASKQIGEFMFSDGYKDQMRAGQPETLIPKEQSRLSILANKRRGIVGGSEDRSGARALTFAEAIFEAIVYRFYEDPTMIAFGEDVREFGGAFGVYRGLADCLPYHRLFNTPIAEAGMVGAAVGYGLSGGRTVVEIMYADFLGRAGDEVFNQLSKWQAMSGGILEMPVVVRMSVGYNYGAQHAQEWTSLVAHIPGLKIMFPATAYDAKGMMNLALRGTDPVIFFESQRLYGQPETLVAGGVPVGYYEVEMGQPAVRRQASDLTIITIGPVLYRALEAADELEAYGVSAEIIDVRFLNPLDYEIILESVRKTGRALVVSDACERSSFAHTIACNVSQMAFDFLDAPVVVLGARNWIAPPAQLEPTIFPTKEWIMDIVHERILPLAGYTPRTKQGISEILKRNRKGV